MKVKAYYTHAIEINVPDEFSPIISNPDWWRPQDESLEELAAELWDYIYNRVDGLERVDNEKGETILEA